MLGAGVLVLYFEILHKLYFLCHFAPPQLASQLSLKAVQILNAERIDWEVLDLSFFLGNIIRVDLGLFSPLNLALGPNPKRDFSFS